MAKLSAKDPRAVKLFNGMSTSCNEAFADLQKKQKESKNSPELKKQFPPYVTTRTCGLLSTLNGLIEISGVGSCNVIENLPNVLNLLSILKPSNLKQLLSHHNFKHVSNLQNLLPLDIDPE